MSLGDLRPAQSLSEQLRHPVSGHSDSEVTTNHHARLSALLRARVAEHPPTFVDEDFDDYAESMTSSTLTDRVPALTRGSSIDSFEGSAMQTDIASVLQGGFVLDSDDGILTLPSSYTEPDADLLCPFQILDCTETFASVREFKIHVFSHFRGHPLPTSASCFLCEDKFEQTPEDDPALAWNRMLGHMAHDHFRRGQQFGTIRADFALMRWMYDRRIISDHYFKRTQIRPVPTVFPAASRRASEVSTVIPEAPSPPSASSPISTASEPVVWSRRSSYSNQTYVTFAGARAERRRRDSVRPMLRPTRVATG